MRYVAVLSLFLFLSLHSCFAQAGSPDDMDPILMNESDMPHWRHWQTANGLASDWVNMIWINSDGSLWITHKNQALLFDLENKTPGTNPPDRDGAALYGDPGLDARVEPVRPPLYDKTVTVASGGERDTVTVRIRMNEEGSPGFTGKWGNRHPIALLPFRVKDVRIESTDAYKAEVTDNFALMYIWKKEDAPLQKGEERSVTFTAKRVVPVTAVEGTFVHTASSPKAFELWQNTPNPFNQATAIHYRLTESAQVLLRIYDAHGGLVRTLVHEEQGAGQYTLRWDGRDRDGKDVASGVYFCRLNIGKEEGMKTRKMVLIR